jgi:hypothetical protein
MHREIKNCHGTTLTITSEEWSCAIGHDVSTAITAEGGCHTNSKRIGFSFENVKWPLW